MKATERNKEIRRILAGLVTYELDGAVMTAARNLFEVQFDGGIPGTRKAQTLGIREKLWQFRFHGDVDKVYAACEEAFFHLGRRVYLYTAPDALAMLYRPAFRHALIVTMEGTEEELLLGLYTARSLQTRLNIRLAYRRIAEELPAELVETEVTMLPESEAPEAEKPEKAEEPARAESSDKPGKRLQRAQSFRAKKKKK